MWWIGLGRQWVGRERFLAPTTRQYARKGALVAAAGHYGGSTAALVRCPFAVVAAATAVDCCRRAGEGRRGDRQQIKERCVSSTA